MIYQFPQSLETKNNENESPLTIAYQYCKDTNVIWLLLIYGPEAVNTLTTREIYLFITYWNKNHWWILMLFNKHEHCSYDVCSTCLSESTKLPNKTPLYYALCDHPDSTLQVLIECYPQSLAILMVPKERLPLHLSCIHGKLSIIPFSSKTIQMMCNNMAIIIDCHYTMLPTI